MSAKPGSYIQTRTKGLITAVVRRTGLDAETVKKVMDALREEIYEDIVKGVNVVWDHLGTFKVLWQNRVAPDPLTGRKGASVYVGFRNSGSFQKRVRSYFDS